MPPTLATWCVRRLLPAAMAVAGVLTVPSIAAAEAHPYLAEAEVNQQWFAPVASGEAVYLGPETGPATAAPSLVLRKAALRPQPLTLHLQSDARRCLLVSGEVEIAVALTGETSSLVLDGDPLRPTLRLDGRELAPQRGPWIRLLLRQDQPMVALRFDGATYVNVRFEPAPSRRSTTEGRSTAGPNVDGTVPPATPRTPRVGSAAAVSSPSGTPGEAAIVAPSARAAADRPAQRLEAAPPERAPVPVSRHGDEDLLEPTELLWRLDVDAGVDLPSAYFFRGLGRVNQGLLVQPWTDVSLQVFRGAERELRWLNQVELRVGLRSTHRNSEDPIGSDSEKWLELDWYGGIAATVFDHFEILGNYRNVESISTAFRDIHLFEGRITFDDADPAYNWSLQPYVLISGEFEHQSDAGYLTPFNSNDPVFSTGIYLEVGVQPRFELFHWRTEQPVTLAVPVAVGLSLTDYFEGVDGEDETFGFVDLGVELNVPLVSFPTATQRRFLWSLNAGLHLLLLGDNAEELSQRFGTGGDGVEVIGSLGIMLEY